MKTRILVAAIALTVAGTASAEAWRWSVTPYLWATDVGIDVAVHDRALVDTTIPFDDLLEDLDSAALLRVEAMRGEHGMALDLFDVVLRDESGRVPLPGGPGDELSLNAEIGMTLLDITGVYDPEGDGQGLGLLYGARLLNQRENLAVGLYAGEDALADRRIEADDTYVDGLLGLRYAGSLPGRWDYELVADVSTGGTEFTWSVAPAIGFRFGSREQYRLTAGYRHLAMDLPSGQAADLDMTLTGFLVGFRFEF
jgi:hypothetical protein